MRTRYLWLFVALLVMGVLSACDPEDLETLTNNTSDFAMPDRPSGLATARVSNVIDGDTLDLSDGTRIRLLSINTPERDEPLYNEAKSFLEKRVEGETVYIEYDQERTDQFGRTLAYIWLGDDLINAEIILAGYAAAYIFEPNTRYANAIENAEAIAKAQSIGMWERGASGVEIAFIEYDAPGPDEDNPNGEWIELTNTTSASINLRGYTLQDESSSNIYEFGSFSLSAGATVQIYSGCGSDTSRVLYWCADGAVWNNNGDTAVLRDSSGNFVDDYRYSR